jgi:formylglycine-generating enzyme required for sulfatase activity
MRRLTFTSVTSVVAIVLIGAGAADALEFDWVTVGDPGNACDQQMQGCFGAVTYTYQISKYEVTNAQYAEFLNAVAATDTYGLYDTQMSEALGYGGIRSSGDPGSLTFEAIAGRENMPVNWVSFYDTLRFANWLSNGQPTGMQDSATTEDGAYTFSGSTSVGPANEGATTYLPTEDEWYKAAYYDGASMSYFDYPAGADEQTACGLPGPAANTANCNEIVGDLTDAGSYPGSASPYGTFDQGGNVNEWNEGVTGTNPDQRSMRGGTFMFNASPIYLAAEYPLGGDARADYYSIGFRVTSVPEPAALPLHLAAVATLAWLRTRSSRPSPR